MVLYVNVFVRLSSIELLKRSTLPRPCSLRLWSVSGTVCCPHVNRDPSRRQSFLGFPQPSHLEC